MEDHPYPYDLAVIGSGPAGVRAALQAARHGQRVLLAEKKAFVGDVFLETGSITSKTLREAVFQIAGAARRPGASAAAAPRARFAFADWLARIDQVSRHELETRHRQLRGAGVEVVAAQAAFIDPHTLLLDHTDGSGRREASAARILIASGSSASRAAQIPFDGQSILSSDEILLMDRLPESLLVIGAGIIGIEYASLFNALGVQVTLLELAAQLLPFVDTELVDALLVHLRQRGLKVIAGSPVISVEPAVDASGLLHATTASGARYAAEKLLYCAGRHANLTQLNLENAGLTATAAGLLAVNAHFQTAVPHIYAAGDVTGFPSLASLAGEQGRLAAAAALGLPGESTAHLLPYAIYSLPEISTIGLSEQDCQAQARPYAIGKAYFREVARGQILGDTTGFIKLVFDPTSLALLGAHILGEGASELIHIPQAVLELGGDLNYLARAVFNYPTLSECFKNAAQDGLNRLK